MLTHVDQNESDWHLLTRLARQYDAIAKPANGNLLVAPRGQAHSVSAKPLPEVSLTPISVTNYRVTLADRDRYGAVVVYWHDTATGQTVPVKIGTGTPVYTQRRIEADAATAQAMAQAQLLALNRGTGTLQLTLPGNPAIGAETPLRLHGFGPGIDGRWIVTRARHTFNHNGISSQIEANTN